jgi:hypothetical protein
MKSMALINCPECNKALSDSVKKCIHCGYSFKSDLFVGKKLRDLIKLSRNMKVFFLFFFPTLIIIGIFYFNSSIVKVDTKVNVKTEQKKIKEKEEFGKKLQTYFGAWYCITDDTKGRIAWKFYIDNINSETISLLVSQQQNEVYIDTLDDPFKFIAESVPLKGKWDEKEKGFKVVYNPTDFIVFRVDQYGYLYWKTGDENSKWIKLFREYSSSSIFKK